MKNYAEDYNKKLNMMASSLKIAIIAFMAIIIYMKLPKYWSELGIKNNGQFNLYTAEFFSFILGLSYLSWLIISKKTKFLKKFKGSSFIENIFFIFIISLSLDLSEAYQNEYKYLLILVIISSVIQHGSREGIVTALLSSVSILGGDLLAKPLENGINVYFQKDLVVMGVFVFIAWILGYYVDMEVKNNRKKDEVLNMLSTELEEKDRKRKEMEILLLNNKICYDMLFENSLNAIIVHNNGVIIYANISAAKLLGYENPIELNGQMFYNHYSENLRNDMKTRYLDISSNKLSKVIEEEEILSYSGSVIPVRNTSSSFTYKGEASVLTLLLDISSERKVEILERGVEENLKLLNESREFNVLITNFFTNMSHELKTPVNVIYSAIQTISMYMDNHIVNIEEEKCRIYLRTMKQNCLRMIRLINNLLDITKLDSGFIKANKKNGNIIGVVEDIIQSVASYVQSKNIELIFDTDIEEKIMGFDHDMMERIMLNLISNAIKYSNPNGRINVNIEDKKSSIVIRVKDGGSGIPKDKINVIFERFGQVNSSLSRQCEGTGVGLYLVKSFVEMHDGKICVKSREGYGSEFIIMLPTKLGVSEKYQDRALHKTQVERIQIEFSDIYSI